MSAVLNSETHEIGEASASSDISFISPISNEMLAVEHLLQHEIQSDVREAYEISGHTLAAGGKRLRPAAVLLAARAVQGAFPTKTIYASAAAVELIHMASLIHDDVVDNADQRRGIPTANIAFGNQISVLVGDYLLAKSIYLASREGNIDVIRIFSKVTVGLSEGEVLQITSRGEPKTTEDRYFDIIRRKTAGFIAGCCEVGATLAEGSPKAVEALTVYGMKIGIAFQIADDVLDFLADSATTGKPRCSDLREGKMTLPLINALSKLSDSDQLRHKIAGLISKPGEISDSDVELICDFIDTSGGFDYARASARTYIRDASDSICAALPSSDYRDSLISLADYALSRTK